jgi:hypothetical protein
MKNKKFYFILFFVVHHIKCDSLLNKGHKVYDQKKKSEKKIVGGDLEKIGSADHVI